MAMTPKQFKAAREALGFTPTSLAREWGLPRHGRRSIYHWETGERPVNVLAAYALTLMLEHAGLPVPDKA